MTTTTTTTTQERWLDKYEAGAVVRLHPRTLVRKAREGEVEYVVSANKFLFSPEALDKYLRGGTKAAKPARNPRRKTK